MNSVIVVLVLLLAIAASLVIVRISAFKIPTPLLQISIGTFLASPWIGITVELDPEIFLLLFIPPILFADGWRFPKKEFVQLWRPIMALAVGLVFFTILCMGYFIHWLVPPITLPVAFALAAVLSPTDAFAVSSICGHSKMPPRLMHVLEGESLMNDASGLVAFKFAIAAAMLGEFSFTQASSSFVLVAVGGFIVGAFVSVAATMLHQQVAKYSSDEPGVQVILLLLIPFAAYLLAEELAVSGILAAVGAGMAMSYTQTHNRTSTSARLLGNSVWSLLEFVFNGMSFLLLGLQIPSVFNAIHRDQILAGNVSLIELCLYAVAITLVLFALRFIWVLVADFVKNPHVHRHSPYPRFLIVLVATFAGVRGAITMAAIMATPLFFEQRSLLIFLATGVILMSLLVGSIMLPRLAKRFAGVAPDPLAGERRYVLKLIAEAAVKRIALLKEELRTDVTDVGDEELIESVAESLEKEYQREFATLSDEHEAMREMTLIHALETQLRLAAVREERKELYRLYSLRQLSQPTLSTLLRDIDLRETALESKRRHVRP